MAIEVSKATTDDAAPASDRFLPPWTVGDLPVAPPRGWRTWILLIGPGVLLAGASVGSGEWLFGPAVSAQYGATLLWLAGLSIVFQVFCNLEMMRYTVYCGESIVLGFLRSWPGPRLWIVWFAVLDLAAIWPFNASNAAVPLAAAILGRLPGTGFVWIAGFEVPERQLVKLLGYAIFLAAFVPLIFGGTIYKMLERVMALKLVVVLSFLTLTAVFMVSATNAWQVLGGFFQVGTVPLPAQTIVAGRNFIVSDRVGLTLLTVKGTIEDGTPLVTQYDVDRTAAGQPRVEKFNVAAQVPGEYRSAFDTLSARAVSLAQPGRFVIEDVLSSVAPAGEQHPSPLSPGADNLNAPLSPGAENLHTPLSPRAKDSHTPLSPSGRGAGGEGVGTPANGTEHPAMLTITGSIDAARAWHAEQFTVTRPGRPPDRYPQLAEVPEPYRARAAELVRTEGLHLVNLATYYKENGALPPLDWAMLAAFAAIAGAGGMTNTLFSNYARDAGWGMGARVGTIPSAIGARNIQLSHVGERCQLDAPNRARWRDWMRHIRRDQLAIWMLASAVGMALPCMLSLEFLRHAPVSGDRVAAMMAAGMAERYPQLSQFLWGSTLLCGFLVLFPGQILGCDQISRRWTDIIWTCNSRARQMPGHRVRVIYYSILTIYCLWGLVALTLFDPLQIAKISGVLMNVALGWTAIHAVYVNRTMLPHELRSPLWMQIGSIACGIFFLGISAIVFANL
ncbi:MAG: Nramp family divalent metal transporter [Pirellulales bacterium]